MSQSDTSFYYPVIHGVIERIEQFPFRVEYYCTVDGLGKILVHPTLVYPNTPNEVGLHVAIRQLEKSRGWACSSIELWTTDHEDMVRLIYNDCPAAIRLTLKQIGITIDRKDLYKFVQTWSALLHHAKSPRAALMIILTNEEPSHRSKILSLLFLLTPNPLSVFLAFDMPFSGQLRKIIDHIEEDIWIRINWPSILENSGSVQVFFVAYMTSMLATFHSLKTPWAREVHSTRSQIALTAFYSLPIEMGSQFLAYIKPFEYSPDYMDRLYETSTRLYSLLTSEKIPLQWKVSFDEQAREIILKGTVDGNNMTYSPTYALVVFYLIQLRAGLKEFRQYWPLKRLRAQFEFVLNSGILSEPKIIKSFCEPQFLSAVFEVFHSKSQWGLRRKVAFEAVENMCNWNPISSDLHVQLIEQMIKEFPDIPKQVELRQLVGEYRKAVGVEKARRTKNGSRIQQLLLNLS